MPLGFGLVFASCDRKPRPIREDFYLKRGGAPQGVIGCVRVRGGGGGVPVSLGCFNCGSMFPCRLAVVRVCVAELKPRPLPRPLKHNLVAN